jgi:FKBP-type peptidyl-prolyl cis-trans isomerase SlyD
MMQRSHIIQDSKYVELIYKVIDKKTGNVFSGIEYPVGYVHGVNDTLGKQVITELEGRKQGDIIEIEIDVEKIYGSRDESLVFIDKIENVPAEYQKVGTKVVMENSKRESKEFLVTKVDDKTVTIDGNNPLCGREVKFVLEILLVRDATDEEMEAGGMIDEQPDMEQLLTETFA